MDVEAQEKICGEKFKTLFNRVDDLEHQQDQIYKIATSVELLSQSQNNLTKSVETLTRQVQEIASKPAKNWDKLIWIICSGIAGAVITLVLQKIGLAP